jgi:hypothetical protein
VTGQINTVAAVYVCSSGVHPSPKYVRMSWRPRVRRRPRSGLVVPVVVRIGGRAGEQRGEHLPV